MKAIELALLAAGGVVGTFLRFRISEFQLFLGNLPISVLIVNVVGSFILGSFAALSLQWHIDSKYAFLIAIGFCGSLTTMSSFALETSNLMDNRQLGLVAVNILANVGLSLVAIYCGKALVSLILKS